MSILKLHYTYEPIKWIFVANILLIIGLFKSSKICVMIHGFGFLIITTLTVSFAIILGLSDLVLETSTQYLHSIVGAILIVMMIIQVCFGISLRIINMIQFNSFEIKSTSLFHTILGISIWLICKFQIYYVKQYLTMLSTQAAILTVLFQVLSIALYLWISLKNRMEENPNKFLQNKGDNLRKVTTLKEFQNQQDLVIIKNKVYDLNPMKNWHPPGFQIIGQAKSRQLDKYLLGIYPSELLNIDRHSHSSLALNLLGEPIAQTDIRSNISNLPQVIEVVIIKMQKLAENPTIYEMHLKSTQASFSFMPYEDVKELGRYYSLTIDNEITRLYTNVNFLQNQNVLLMKKCLEKSRSLDQYLGNRQNFGSTVPILFKYYGDGLFTSRLVDDRIKKLQLSSQLGLGFSLNQAKNGEIIIVAGGTGIYPFSDLIDLLYKNKKAKENSPFREEILKNNPILYNKPFERFTFRFLLSFPHFQEIHPITYQQLIQLSEDPSISITLRITRPVEHLQTKKIQFTKDYFDPEIKKLIQRGHFSKILICGPSKMQKGLAKLIKELQLSENFYTFM